MKRIPALVLLLAFVLSLTLTAGAEEFLKNGSFDGQTGWGTWQNGNDGDAEFEVTDGVAHIRNLQPVAANFNQEAPLEPGHTYRLSADIRTEGVSQEGQGACISYTGYDSEDNWLCETTSAGLFGDNDWTHVSCMFTVPEDCCRVILNVRIYFATGDGWFDNFTVEELDNTSPESGVIAMELSDTANTYPINGFGAEWDPKLLYSANTKKYVMDSDVELVAERIDILNIARVRMMVLPEWYEPRNDNDDPYVTDFSAFHFDDWGSVNEMSSLWRYLEICQEKGVKVTLTWWGVTTPGSWLACDGVTSQWAAAPNNLDEMAESISALLRYAILDRGFTCIDSVILQNEPYYSYVTHEGSVDFENYVEYYKTVRARLDSDGLQDIGLIGSDDSTDLSWFQNSVDELSDVVIGFDSHSYNYRAEDFMLGEQIRNFTSARTEYTDLPFFYGEFGDGSTVGAYSTLTVDDYERGLFIGIHAINSLKEGSTGSLYWPLHDVYYYSGDANDGNNGGKMAMGLFAFKDEDWRVRPTYHAWGLICNAAISGAEVYDITGETDWAEAVAVRTDSGHWAILADNRTEASQTLTIKAPAIGEELALTVFCESAVTEEDTLIQPTGTVVPDEEGVYTFELPAMSFAVLSNIDDADREAAHEFADLDFSGVSYEDPEPPEGWEKSVSEASESETSDSSVDETQPEESAEEEGGSSPAPYLALGAALVAVGGGLTAVRARKKNNQ